MSSGRRIVLVLYIIRTVAAAGGHQVTPPPASVGPVFAAPVGNQTAAIGREAVFTCSIRNIEKYKVGWLRTSDRTILSVHARTVTHNTRISVSYETGGSGGGSGSFGTNQTSEEANIGTWRLHIRHLKESDRDCYMCQINTSPMRSEEGCLDILVPPDIVYGGETSADLAVSEGDNATLTCSATGRPAPRVSWRREDGEPILTRSSSSTSSGGGQNKVINDPIVEQVREIIGPAAEGLSNTVDSDCISDNFTDKNEEFEVEWLDEASEYYMEGGEGGTEIDEDGIADDEDNTEDVLNFLCKNKPSWKKWNPKKLQIPISTALKIPDKRKSQESVDSIASTSGQVKRTKVNNDFASAEKAETKKATDQLKQKRNNKKTNELASNRLAKFAALADCKIDLVCQIMENGKEKHDLETEILRVQLEKEKIEVTVKQKELELKTLMVERERKRFQNENPSYHNL